MKRTLFSWALVVTLLAVSGCGMFQEKLSEQAEYDRAMLVTSADARQIGYRLTWTYDMGLDPDGSVTAVEVLDDLVVSIEAPTNVVTAISTKDGTVAWRRVVGEKLSTLFPPVRKGKKIYINSENRFYRVDAATGKTVDTSILEFAVNHKPLLVESFAIFGASNGKVFAHDIETGYSKWVYKMPAGVRSMPVRNGNYVFVVDGKGTYGMFNGLSGELIWKGVTFGGVTADPVVTRSGVFVACEDFSFYSFDRATGKDRNGWPYRTSIRLVQDPSAVGDSIFLPVPTVGLVSVDPVNGAELWKYPKIVQPVTIDSTNRLLVSSGSSLAYLDNQTGKQIVEVPSKPINKIIRGDGFLVLVSPDGRIQRYDAIK